MGAIQKALATVGVTKQAALGTAEANPAYIHGVTGGSEIDITLTQDLAPLTSAFRAAPHVDRTESVGAVNVQTRAFVGAAGVWLLGAFGAVASTGTTGSYVHTFTPANAAQILTVFGLRGTQNYKLKDVIVDEFEIAWEGAGPCDLTVTGIGTVFEFISAPTPDADETKLPYFQAGGGTFKMDTDSATPVTARIAGGSIKVMNNAAPVPTSTSISPVEIFPGQQQYEVNLTVYPEDFTLWRSIWSGSDAGTAVSESTVYGSFEITFAIGSATLEFEALRCAFETNFPEADPSGGPVELSLVGRPVLPASGNAAVTAVLSNAIASY